MPPDPARGEQPPSADVRRKSRLNANSSTRARARDTVKVNYGGRSAI